jgi:hypothetical protein
MMTPEEFCRQRGIDERHVGLAVKALNGERMPRSAVDEEPIFSTLVREWNEYRRSQTRTTAEPR